MVEFTELDKEFGFPEGTIDSVWQQESGRGKHLVSAAGAREDFQFMPATRQEMIRKYGLDPWKDKESGARCCALYVADLTQKFGGDLHKGLSAYNAGAGNVQAAIKKYGDAWLANMKPETQNYARAIMGRVGVNLDAHIAYSHLDKTTTEQDAEELEKRRKTLKTLGMNEKAVDDIAPKDLLGKIFFALIAMFLDVKAPVADNATAVTPPPVPNQKKIDSVVKTPALG